MQKIQCIKEYPMVGGKIPVDTFLTEIETELGKSSYKDSENNIYNFDNSEIIFSLEFHKSFIRVE